MPENQIIVETIVSPLFAENTYISHLGDSQECIVVDPGIDPESILALIRGRNLTPRAILNTHGHADHIAGNGTLMAAFPDCPLIIGEGDAFKLTDPAANLSAGYGLALVSPPADELVREGDVRTWAGIELSVRHTPGHSPGHVVFLCKLETPWIVFGGDVLFQGSIGRTDFPDGDFDDLRRSIHEKLFTLPADTIVYTGHGEPTTIGEEIRTNPFVGKPAGFAISPGAGKG